MFLNTRQEEFVQELHADIQLQVKRALAMQAFDEPAMWMMYDEYGDSPDELTMDILADKIWKTLNILTSGYRKKRRNNILDDAAFGRLRTEAARYHGLT